MGNKKNYLTYKPFDNIKMIHPDGHLMCYISNKRSRWYLKNNLALDNLDGSITLTFIPNGVGEHTDILQHRSQMCVVTGSSEQLTKHHVIPSQYRVYFPMQYKAKNSSDLLILHRDIHNEYEVEAEKLKKQLLNDYITKDDLDKYNDYLVAYRHNKTLIKSYNKIPAKNQILFQMKIDGYKEKYNIPKNINIHDINIKETVDFNKIIVEKVGVEKLIILWKYHFLKYAKPKYLSDWWKPNLIKIIKHKECEIKYINIDDNLKKFLIKYKVWQ